jgi:hypothetical protein
MAVLSVRAAAMGLMQPRTTDSDALPHRWRNLLPLTGLTRAQVHTVDTLARQRLPVAPGQPWGLPLGVRLLLVLIHLRTNLTTRALAALFDTSQSAVDRIIHHLDPVLADTLTPDSRADRDGGVWIIDGTLIPVHDQTITAPSKNYRRSINTHVICAERRRVVAVGQCWPGNRNDVMAALHTIAYLLTGDRVVLGDGGYRGIPAISTPARDRTGRTICDHHYRTLSRIRARIENVIVRLKDWQILRQRRRRDDAVNHALHIITGL